MGSRIPEITDEAWTRFTQAGGEPAVPEDFGAMLEAYLDPEAIRANVREINAEAAPKTIPEKPQETLDLHEKNVTAAQEAVDRCIRGAYAKGIRQVRIIVGRGLHSAGEPVIPTITRQQLQGLMQKGLLTRVGIEKGSRGGALIVTVKKNPKGSVQG